MHKERKFGDRDFSVKSSSLEVSLVIDPHCKKVPPCRLEAPALTLTGEDLAAKNASEAEPTFAEEVIPPEMAAALSTTPQALEKFVKLPPRPLKRRGFQAPTQVTLAL